MNIPTKPPQPPFLPATPYSAAPFGVGGGSGWHPHSWDGGIPANPSLPNYPAQAWVHSQFPPVDTAALYYGNGCDVRLRPHVLNSLISELASTAERAEVGYRASSLQNLETSVRYLIQRGLPRGEMFVEANPWHFDMTLDPRATRYNNYMTLTCVPRFLDVQTTQNRGYVRMNVNGLGYVPLLRNDGQELRAADLLAGKPFACAYFNGAFYYLGLVFSQVPLVLVGTINFWIRPDGNDDTGDGTANSPDKAFRTINGCWYAVGSRYAGSPSAHIAMRLGIPGIYEAGSIGPFGAAITLTGDIGNRAGYRIMSNEATSPWNSYALYVQGVNRFGLYGVNCVTTNPSPRPNFSSVISFDSSVATLQAVQCSLEASNPETTIIYAANGARVLNVGGSDVRIVGNGQSIGMGFTCIGNSSFGGTGGGPSAHWHWENMRFTGAGYSVSYSSSVSLNNCTVAAANTLGPRYAVTINSIITTSGQPIPGDVDGTIGLFSAVA
ncbi:MAG: hypothetical protein C5B54_00075 [Acidobacteria bacterium]|nr:MAG: hypothetical protein C5B54_00075 [Acidobacteriota bacterium]